MRWKDLSIALDERAISLKNLAVNGYSGRLHIHADGSINAQKLLRKDHSQDAVEPVESVQADETQPWSFDAPSISIVDSQIDFMDESLPIQFRTIIGDLNGEIRNLSTRYSGYRYFVLPVLRAQHRFLC